jgi:hypothetical protein
MTSLLPAPWASRASIAMTESLRIIDPMLYPATADRNGRKRHLAQHFLPISAQVRPKQTVAEGGGFDWI